jgi:hypothetical protein
VLIDFRSGLSANRNAQVPHLLSCWRHLDLDVVAKPAQAVQQLTFGQMGEISAQVGADSPNLAQSAGMPSAS